MTSPDNRPPMDIRGSSTESDTSSRLESNRDIALPLPNDGDNSLDPNIPFFVTVPATPRYNQSGQPSTSSSSSDIHNAANQHGTDHPAAFRRDQSTQSNSSSQSSGPQAITGSQSRRRVQPRRQQPIQSRNSAVQLESAALKDFSSIAIVLDRLPKYITTREIWDSLTSYKLSISSIQLLENRYGERTDQAKVYIAPPPSSWPPWGENSGNNCIIHMKDSSSLRIPILSTTPNRAGAVKTPNNRYIPRQLDFTLQSLHFGMLAHESAMFKLPQYDYQDVVMSVKFFRKEFELTFKAHIGPHGTKDFMIRINFSHVKKILRVTLENGEPALVILLPSPPKYYCLMPVYHDDTQLTWQDWDQWARLTDITSNKRKLKGTPAGLKKQPDGSVDIGRWTTYHLGMTPETLSLWERIDMYLSDYNIKTEGVTNFHLTSPGDTNAWKLLDNSADSLSLEILHSGHFFHLPFEVRYQLEACISHGLLNEYSIGINFLEKLTSFDATKARMILEGVAELNRIFYDPMKVFEDNDILNYWPNARVPRHAALVRRAVITPTTVYFKTPCVELTNRVLRQYSSLTDRFLRVQFSDEMTFGKIFSSPQNSKKDDNVYLRVHRALSNGIVVGDRCYKFLAFSNSQFRENGAFFFCDTDHITCDTIRAEMGQFQHIRSVGKYAARMGQCFTTTRQVSGITQYNIYRIDDIERMSDGRVWSFTDGVGKISLFHAKMIAHERGLPEVPSCYQMRIGGCKGVLVCWPDVPSDEIHIRPSQEKFKTESQRLEIIKTSSYSHATLNRQIIPILSALGVKDGLFEEMLIEELEEYIEGLSDPFKAGELLRSRQDENQVTLTMAEMVDTFMDTNEPFLKTLLDLWKCWVLRRIKYKAAISVKESAMLYGVVDELGVLRGHSKNTEGKGYNRIDTLPQIYLQVPIESWDGSPTTNYKVVTGLCVVGRNPSLHAGDVRVVQAVDVPELAHLKNVVVFPQTGDRDIPSMCSGGDLDGDDYFVFWDKRLIPTEWDHPPMDHDASSGAAEVEGPADVSIEDVTRFFAQYMKNDSLGTIASAHFAQADKHGVKHPKCIELAKLHSRAVDYIKSGSPAIMAKNLRPEKWPHWFEKDPHYRSRTVVGQIYDCMCMKTEDMEWHPAHDKPFDKRILSRYQLDREILDKASEIKANYDIAMRRLMGQHEAPVTEFEIWSTFILTRPRVGNDYKLQENMGREVSVLKERFRTLCVEAVTGVEQKQSYASACVTADREKFNRFVAAMYTVTFDQVQAAMRERKMPQVDDEGEAVEVQMPLISFPWLFHRELARVALGHEADATTPVEAIPKEAVNSGENEPQLVHEVRSKKEGGRDGEDYVRISSEKIIHRDQVLDHFIENDEGVVKSQPTTRTIASASPVKDSQLTSDTARDSPIEYTLNSSLPTSRASDQEHDDDEEFEEFEFEEVGDVLVQEEEDALEVLAKKIGM